MSNFQQQTISHNLWFVIQPNLLISKLEDSTICPTVPVHRVQNLSLVCKDKGT